MAQWIRRLTTNQEIPGSTPGSLIIFANLLWRNKLQLSRLITNVERRQTVNIFIVPRQLENELLRNNLFENGVSTLSLENQKTYTVADKTGAQKLKLTLYLRHMSATFVVYTIWKTV